MKLEVKRPASLMSVSTSTHDSSATRVGRQVFCPRYRHRQNEQRPFNALGDNNEPLVKTEVMVEGLRA